MSEAPQQQTTVASVTASTTRDWSWFGRARLNRIADDDEQRRDGKGKKMKGKSKPSSPRKAEAARMNGRKGGTRSPERSCYNALKTGITAKKFSILRDGRKLPEYQQHVEHAKAVIQDLPGPLNIEDVDAVELAETRRLVLRRGLRALLRETEKPGSGMLSFAMPNLQRHYHAAQRQYAETFEWFKEIRKRGRAPLPPAGDDFAIEVEEQLPELTDGCSVMITVMATPPEGDQRL